MPNPTLNDPIAEQAIEWMVLVRSGTATAADHTAFAQWRAADPNREAACARIERTLHQLQTAVTQSATRDAVRKALLVSPGRRKALRGLLALAGLGLASGAIIRQTHLAADLRTATAERRTWTLSDGSTVVLNARSAADLDFDAHRRLIHLREGELIATVAPDTARPFIVQTRNGTARALGTRFLVRQDESATRVVVLHSSVEIETVSGARRVLATGQGATFDSSHVIESGNASAAEAAWQDGWLEVHDQSLGEVIAALRPYRSGIIRVAPEAAGLRVTGLFPLADTDRTLAALTETLPIQVRRHTDYWVVVEARNSK